MFARERLGAALIRSATLLGILAIARVNRTRVVGMVHNVIPSERRQPSLESVMERRFAARVDGSISLTAEGDREAVRRLPALGRRPRFVIS